MSRRTNTVSLISNLVSRQTSSAHMGNRSPSAVATLTTHIVLLAVTLLMISARLYLRIKIHKARRLLLSDAFMGAAWCASLMTAGFNVAIYKHGALNPDIDFTLRNWDTTIENFEYVAKMVWAGTIPFYACLYLCKLSLLAVYFELFPVFMAKLRFILWVTLGFVICSWTTSMGLQLFMCWPIARNWTFTQPELMCDVTIPATIFHVGWALHFTGSIVIFILPFFVIQNLQMRREMKIGVYCALSLGAIDIAFSLTRFIAIQLADGVEFRAITSVELWSLLDMMIGLLVTCLPSLRPYLRRGFKASSVGLSHGPNTYGPGQSIVVNRRVMTTSTPGRWKAHDEFEEIPREKMGAVLEEDDGASGRIITIGNVVHVDGGPDVGNEARDSWHDDKRSNNSDIELLWVQRPT